MKPFSTRAISLTLLLMWCGNAHAERLESDTDRARRLDSGVTRMPESPSGLRHRGSHVTPESDIPRRSPDLGEPSSPLSPSIGPGSGLLGPEAGSGPARLRSGAKVDSRELPRTRVER